MNAKEKFLNHAIEFVNQNKKPFTFRDFILLGYTHENFNQLIHRCKNEIIKVGKDMYFPKSLCNTLYSSITDNISDKTPSPLTNPDLLLYFLAQNIHNIRSTFKTVTGIYAKLIKQGHNPEPNSPLHEIRLESPSFNLMDIKIYIYPTDTVKIIIRCSSNPIILNHKDIDKLTDTYEQLRQYLSSYASHIPPLDYMRITQFDYAQDAIYYKIGNFTFNMEFPTFKKHLVKIYYQ